MNSSIVLSSRTIALPYDCMNRIFEYLSQMIDSKWALEFDAKGHIRMRINPYSGFYTNISQLNEYKRQITGGKYLTLRLPDMEVEALEQPRPMSNKATLDTNMANGHMDFGWCYSYTNPLNGKSEHIYTSARYYILNNSGIFLGGTLLRDDSAYNVTDYSATNSVVTIGVSTVNMDWIDEEIVMDAAEGLVMLNGGADDNGSADDDIEWE